MPIRNALTFCKMYVLVSHAKEQEHSISNRLYILATSWELMLMADADTQYCLVLGSCNIKEFSAAFLIFQQDLRLFALWETGSQSDVKNQYKWCRLSSIDALLKKQGECCTFYFICSQTKAIMALLWSPLPDFSALVPGPGK